MKVYTLSTSACSAKAAPPLGPRAGTQLRTPGGNLLDCWHNPDKELGDTHPASTISSQSFYKVFQQSNMLGILTYQCSEWCELGWLYDYSASRR